MEPGEPARVLKQSPARSVRLEPPAHGAEAPERIVKRFRSRGPLAAARDRARARREFELLRELHALGLAVPRPLELAARDGGWEVAMEFLAGAASFAAILEGRAPWPAEPGRIARELGALCARLQAAGVQHPDLHPGNALLGADGRAFAIDFHKARRARSPWTPPRLEAQLAHVAAGARERTSRRFRARFLWAWWSALPPALRPQRTELPELARRAEARARCERAEHVERRRPRWTRDGTAVHAVELAGGAAFERADREPGLARAVESLIASRAPAREPLAIELPWDSRSQALILFGSWRDLASLWRTAGQLEEHALPAARPLALAKRPKGWAAFELPAGGRTATAWQDLASAHTSSAFGALAAAFHDRAVRPAPLAPASFWIEPNGGVRLTTANRLELALDPSPLPALESWCRLLGATPAHVAELALGFGLGLGLGRVELRALHELFEQS